MMKISTVFRSFCLICVAILGVLGMAAAQSNQNSVFVVTKVPVEAEAAETAAAQNLARDRGRRQAMDILLRRLTAEDDWVYLPRLALGQAAPAQGQYAEFGKQAVTLIPEQLSSMEEGFAVFDEKASRTTYRASITYRFKPDDVRRILKEARLPYSEAQTRQALVLPVLQTDNGVYLWETNNPWARAWLVRPLVNELTPIVLPIGDSADVQSITARQALGFNQNALSVLANRYGVSQVIIAQGYLSQSDGQYSLRVRYLNGFLGSASQVDNSATAETSSSLYDSASGYGRSTGGAASSGEIGRVLTEAYFRGSAGDFPALARRAVTATMAQHGADWKRRTLVDHSAMSTVAVNAYFTSLAEWAGIREALEKSPAVESVKVGALSPDGATLTMVVLGDIRQLVIAMRQADLVLWQNNNDRWNIAPTSIYSAIRERVENVSTLPELENQTDDTRIRNPFAQPEVEWRTTPSGNADFSPPSERELGDAPAQLSPDSLMPQNLEPPETGNGEGTILEQSEDEEEPVSGLY